MQADLTKARTFGDASVEAAAQADEQLRAAYEAYVQIGSERDAASVAGAAASMRAEEAEQAAAGALRREQAALELVGDARARLAAIGAEHEAELRSLRDALAQCSAMAARAEAAEARAVTAEEAHRLAEAGWARVFSVASADVDAAVARATAAEAAAARDSARAGSAEARADALTAELEAAQAQVRSAPVANAWRWPHGTGCCGEGLPLPILSAIAAILAQARAAAQHAHEAERAQAEAAACLVRGPARSAMRPRVRRSELPTVGIPGWRAHLLGVESRGYFTRGVSPCGSRVSVP